jgi:signal transduction histidine kinase
MPPNRSRSLVSIVTATIAVTALMAVALQLLIVCVRSYLAEDDLAQSYVINQVSELRDSLRMRDGKLVLTPSRVPAQYRGAHADAYAYRVVTTDGSVVADHNADWIADRSPWQPGSNHDQDLWVVDLNPGRRLHVAGGRRVTVQSSQVYIEAATRGDPDGQSLRVLAGEVADDVWMPMVPLFVLTIGAAVFSVRRSMRPLQQIATVLESGHDDLSTIKPDGAPLPREVGTFVAAMTRVFARNRELMLAQQGLTARAAHELRTPIAAMMLEIDRVEQHGVERLRADVEDLGRIVDRLLVLSKLEAVQEPRLEPVVLASLVARVCAQLDPIRSASGHTISIRSNDATPVAANAEAVDHALRNLIHNALQYTPPGTVIEIASGPGQRLCVRDHGPGWGVTDPTGLMEPFARGALHVEGTGLGLAIAKQAAASMRGRLTLSTAPDGGAVAEIAW